MKYQITIEDRVFEVRLDGPEPVIDGRPVSASLSRPAGDGRRYLSLDGDSYDIFAVPCRTPGDWTIHFRGQVLPVEALDERTRAIREMSSEARGAGSAPIVAPMPGLVVRVDVEPGDAVVAGQGLVVVEAMKMENELKAPASGTVISVQVKPGETVEKGTILVVVE
jgi:biotin carboxyl carrier protein